MGYLKIIILLCALSILNACTIYKSPDRKDFESLSASFKTQSLQVSSCSQNSVRTQAASSRLVSIQNSELNNESVYLWEHNIGDQHVFESDNLMGIYCLYETN